MNKLTRYISAQFRDPKGLGGVIISLVQNVVNRAMYRSAVSLVNVQRGENVLDIGYGNGHLLKKLYDKQTVRLFGIDISADAMEMARRRNGKADRAGDLHLSVGDCCALPYADDTFAAVTSINTVYFWSDTVKGLSEIRRTLKRGASFYNIVYTKAYLDTVKYTQTGYRKFEIEELTECGRAAGFTDISVKEIVKGKSLAVIYTK